MCFDTQQHIGPTNSNLSISFFSLSLSLRCCLFVVHSAVSLYSEHTHFICRFNFNPNRFEQLINNDHRTSDTNLTTNLSMDLISIYGRRMANGECWMANAAFPLLFYIDPVTTRILKRFIYMLVLMLRAAMFSCVLMVSTYYSVRFWLKRKIFQTWPVQEINCFSISIIDSCATFEILNRTIIWALAISSRLPIQMSSIQFPSATCKKWRYMHKINKYVYNRNGLKAFTLIESHIT